MHDLLTDPLIGVYGKPGRRRLSLPELLAALSAGEVDGYTGIRAHQADPWHVFLVQLAASIQARRPTDGLPVDPGYWRDGLLDLADGIDSAWHLVVEDVTKPAFMQHPWKSWDDEAGVFGVKVTRGKKQLDPKARTPDELDVLVTSKNHDVKMARVDPAAEEAWIYALLLLQTTSGFLGQGNYGIIRMNGGFASRSIASWSRSLDRGTRFQDEVAALNDLREGAISTYNLASKGVVLTWLGQWDRSGNQYQIADLEPWFIEAARPVRLVVEDNGDIVALGATSKARQIGPKSLENGDVGDPWTVLNVQDKKKGRSALTLSSDGFSVQRLTELLFEQGFELTPLQKPRPGDGPGWFLASCLVRGQGTTEGFHHIELPVPPKARMALLAKESRETLGHLAQQLLADAKEVQKALGTALTVLAEGGPEELDFDRVESWVRAIRRKFLLRWQSMYFPVLWGGAEGNNHTLRSEWQQQIVDVAQELFDEAAQALPLPANRAWRAITRARTVWQQMLRKNGLPWAGAVRRDADEMEETAI